MNMTVRKNTLLSVGRWSKLGGSWSGLTAKELLCRAAAPREADSPFKLTGLACLFVRLIFVRQGLVS